MKKIFFLLFTLLSLSASAQWRVPSAISLTWGRINASANLAATTYVNTGSGTKIPFNTSVYLSGVGLSGAPDRMFPTQSGRFRCSFFAIASSAEFNGDGEFHIMQNGVSLGSVFVNMMESAGVNQTFAFIDANLSAGLAVELWYKPVTNDNIVWERGSFFDITQLPNTTN